jgi:tetratricopeptide (TPR) repeat protein
MESGVRRLAAISTVVLSATLAACTSSVPRAGNDPGAVSLGGARGRVPSWLPPYTAAQQALLSPVKTPIQVPAHRVFPDLERFGYAPNRKLVDPIETVKFTKMVATVLHESPRFYFLDKTEPQHANTIAQYGPPGASEPDGWYVTRRDQEGIGRLVRAAFGADARAEFDKGAARLAQKDPRGAAGHFRAAATKSPDVPALRVALGDALAAANDHAGARDAYAEAIRIDSTYSAGHRGMAEVLLKGGDMQTARREAALALAYHPPSKRALAIGDEVAFGNASAGHGRVRPMPIFIDVDSVGAIHVASDGSNPGQMYASCRAVMRYEPEVRATIFKQAIETPYYLSVVEEVICLESAIGAYIFEQAEREDVDSPGESSVESLFRMAQKDGLSGYAMFEILGQHRPERARTAPPEMHRAILEYVEQYVLGGGSPSLPAGTYNARLDVLDNGSGERALEAFAHAVPRQMLSTIPAR